MSVFQIPYIDLSIYQVHNFMLSIHVVLGLPQVREPAVVHGIITFSKKSPFFLSMCP